jgi:hypothetical protein
MGLLTKIKVENREQKIQNLHEDGTFLPALEENYLAFFCEWVVV